MTGEFTHFSLGGRRIYLWLPEGVETAGLNVVYLNEDESFESTLTAILQGLEGPAPFAVAGVSEVAWSRDYSPWEAPALEEGGAPFLGGAGEHLAFLAQVLKPHLESRFAFDPARAALLGYSLGGLAALYALYRTDVFSLVGCLSGSLWFENWIPFMESHAPLRRDAWVYLSLGKSEERSRHPLPSTVGTCTERARGILERELTPPGQVVLEWNSGGHFKGIVNRYQKAMRWLLKAAEPPGAAG